MKRIIHRLLCLCAGALLLAAPALAQAEPIGRLETAPKSFLTETPYVRQCELGSVAADALRAWAGADIALVNTGDLKNDLNAGDVTAADIQKVFREDRELAAAEITPAVLYELLEHAVGQIRVDPATEQIVAESAAFDGFCQISGFRFQYDASADPGQRVLSVTLDDGRKLSPEDTQTHLRLCAAASMLAGDYGFAPVAHEALGSTMSEALAAYVAAHSRLPEEGKERIHVLGARQNTIAGFLPRGVWVAGCAVFMGLLALQRFKFKSYRREFEEDPDMDSPYKKPPRR